MDQQYKPKTPENNEITTPELDKVDEAILNAYKANPNSSINEIGKQLTKIGVIGHPDTVNKRLKRHDYLHLEVTKLRERIDEEILRDHVPLALKIAKNALKDSDLGYKDKHAYVKTILDKSIGDKHQQPPVSNQVNIDKMQVILGQALGIDT